MTNGLLCIGDNVVDLYLDRGVFFPGGNALNVAVLARRFGLSDVAYMGIVGNDREGDHVQACMKAEGLSIAHLRRVEGPNGKAQVTHDAQGDRVFVASNRGGIRRKLMLRMDEDDLALIAATGHVHSSCFSYLEPELPASVPPRAGCRSTFPPCMTRPIWRRSARMSRRLSCPEQGWMTRRVGPDRAGPCTLDRTRSA
jgi:sugar/nucleoside kinase (ribokinase family)